MNMSKLYLYTIVAAVFLILVGAGAYVTKRSIETAASAKLAIAQLESATQSLRKTNEELVSIMRVADQTRLALERQIVDLRQRERDVLDSIEPLEDRESSDVLKEVIGGIRR